MARLTLAQKSHAALVFLLGTRLPQVAEALGEHGFDQAALEEGWLLLRDLAPQLPSPVVDDVERTQFGDLVAFQRRWFPIVHAALARTEPELELELFAGLRVRRRNYMISVGVFVERVESALRGEEPFGHAGLRLRELLERRGLPWSEFEAIQLRMAALDHGIGPGVGRTRSAKEREQAALDALWAWYLEWSGIARQAVRNKVMLHALGLRKVRVPREEISAVATTARLVAAPSAPTPLLQA